MILLAPLNLSFMEKYQTYAGVHVCMRVSEGEYRIRGNFCSM